MKNKIFSKKQTILLFTFIFLLIGCWAILAFLAKEEWVPRLSLWANLVFGTAAIITSVLAIGISVVTLKKEESLRRQKLEEDANKFINENNNEILYLPLCLIANAYDNHHKYSRKIYNSFNTLNRDLQSEVLKQLNYDYKLINGNQWIDTGLEMVRQFIKDNDLGKDFLYDGAKYFHRAMNYSDEPYDSSCEYGHIMPDVFNWNPKIFFKSNNLYQENVCFFDYVESYLNAKEKDPVMYEAHKEQRPLDVLSQMYGFSNCPEVEICYWLMEVVASISSIIIKNNRKAIDIDDTQNMSKGDAQIENYEDRYLDVLMELYNLYLSEKNKSNPSHEEK